MPGVFNSKQISFLAHTNAGEFAYLTACWQPVAKCKQNPNSREEANPSRSLLCTLLIVLSCLSSGSSWGQLQRRKFGGRYYLGSGVEELRQHLSEHFIASNSLCKLWNKPRSSLCCPHSIFPSKQTHCCE